MPVALNSLHRIDINFSGMYFDLLKGQDINSSKFDTSPPQLCNNSALNLNYSSTL